MKPIRVLIADDHPVIRDGMRAILQKVTFIDLVGEAASFAEVSALLATHAADVVVLDIQQMGGSALMFVTGLARDYPNLKIIIFSSSKDMAPELLAAGAHGYLVKDDFSSLLITAIQTVTANVRFLSPTVEVYLAVIARQRLIVQLTDREHSILKRLSAGLGTQAIATDLVLDPRTVQNYIGKLMDKTGCDERIQLVNWYQRTYG